MASRSIGAKPRAKKIVILGDFNPHYHTHLAVNETIIHLSNTFNNEVAFEWIDTDKFEIENDFNTYSGLWIASGSPYKDMNNVLHAIKYARENNIPTFGNCGGFQHMLIEYARNVCGLLYADSEETNPESKEIIISKLTCSLVGQQEEISIDRSSLLFSLIGETNLTGKYHCNYALNPIYIPLLESNGMRMTATNPEGDIRAFEVPSHPFYIGTLFQPALTSTDDEISPILMGFTKLVLVSK
ncbi:MAG: gamma-glutamyl-gamma-aminobutyrate hydrolase family protein [Saprospiraceae bacterium]|uniref:CTP synthase (glutamine hydrolyzing) n=1 Tax=Candidatus Opimibacter skivensis TaxID=2982028 RepID=A0A9D7SSC0_9BACT|nr:gamma-glutamyl-gamma-aminobutyrate hydrolase family protein [Candidatus Opimibacter skivensis]